MLLRCLRLSLVVVALCLVMPLFIAADGPTTDHFIYIPLLMSPAPPQSSEQLIDGAVARGEIDEVLGLVFKVFAAFADERLPKQYRGDDSQVMDTMILSEVGMRFNSLSAETQAILAPFLLPPSAPGSWLELREDDAQWPRDFASQNAIVWHKVPAAGNKAVIWWQDRYPDDAARANAIAEALSNKIWSGLTTLMGREPLSDAGRLDNGGDGRLDIYLVRGTKYLGKMVSYWPYCREAPVYLLIKSSMDGSELLSVATHEFMHALQWSYHTQAGCVVDEYYWLAEATATWAEDFVYPDVQSEQDFASSFLDVPGLALEKPSQTGGSTRHYGAYLFPFYLSHRYVPAIVRTIWDNSEHADSLEAIDMSVPGGFEQQWPEFTAYNWNQVPMGAYQQWDELEDSATFYPIDIELDDVQDAKIPLPLPGGVDHLAAQYYHLKFPDSDARTVAFYNGYTYQVAEQDVDQLWGWEPGSYFGVQITADTMAPEEREGAHVKALVKIAGQDWRVEDWTDKPIATFCRDKADERVEELVLIFSNSLFEPRDATSVRKPKGLAPTLWVSDMGCWQWVGEATYDFVWVRSVHQFDTAQVTWTNERDSQMQAALTPPPGLFWLGRTSFKPTGTFRHTLTGTNSYGERCHYEVDVTTTIADGPYELRVNNYTISGPMHRAYELGGFETIPFTYQYTCPHYGIITATTAPGDFTVFDSPESPPDVVQFDGAIEFTGPDSIFRNTATQHWRFEPQAQP